MWSFKKKPSTSAEVKLEQIKEILFPPLQLMEDVDPQTGTPYKWQVDSTIDMNLDAALIDLQSGHNDGIVHNTLQDSIARLTQIREILDVHMELSPEASYIMVQGTTQKLDVEEIEPSED
jgi:hypothetical protein